MNLSILKKIITTVFTCLILSSCTEQYVFQNQDFEEALIVEATITNELKHQEIKLSRNSSVNDTIKLLETGADVKVIDSDGKEFHFDEKDEKYISENEFQAEPNKNYQLKITTASGKSYSSSKEILTTANTIDLETQVVEKDGQRGVQINVKSFDPTNTSKYYRFKYEETYKIITAYTVAKEIELIPYLNTNQVQLVPPKPNTRICYSTNYSKGITQTNTTKLSEDRVNFPVRFISNTDYTIANRYSIMVSEYTQSGNAYDYYYTSDKLSDSGELLSPNQPGYIIGNVKSTSNLSEKVVGFFEVASVSKKRIFFNFEDIFPLDKQPEYFRDCKPELIYIEPDIQQNYNNIVNTHAYLGDGPGLVTTSYSMVEKECADCTTFSSNVIPSFWEN